MATVDEAVGAKTPMGSDLKAGVDAISLDQEVTFRQYLRLVLPLDGYVFWVRASKIGPSALMGRGLFNAFRPNQPPAIAAAAPELKVMGSLHFATETRQEQEETYASNRVVFTAEQAIDDLNLMAPNTLWIGTWQDPEGPQTPLRFAFSSQSSRYYQAGLWHYVGNAVYADMAPQIIDSPEQLDQRQIVSNSLPAWLAINAYAPAYGIAPPAGLTLFPSFLVPANEVPPYGAVHIEPASTRGIALAPSITRSGRHEQLSAETVRVTLWGSRNDDALAFIDAVSQFTLETNAFGVTNIPVPRDEKRSQAELNAIAMKKTIDFEVSYLQSGLVAVTEQVIKSVKIAFTVDSGPLRGTISADA